MKTATVALLALLALASPALAQYNAQHFGNQTFIYGPNGHSGNEQHFGNQTFGYDNRGNTWNSQRFGNQTFTNGSGPSFNNNGW